LKDHGLFGYTTPLFGVDQDVHFLISIHFHSIWMQIISQRTFSANLVDFELNAYRHFELDETEQGYNTTQAMQSTLEAKSAKGVLIHSSTKTRAKNAP
jgi:hypothetical protein